MNVWCWCDGCNYSRALFNVYIEKQADIAYDNIAEDEFCYTAAANIGVSPGGTRYMSECCKCGWVTTNFHGLRSRITRDKLELLKIKMVLNDS